MSSTLIKGVWASGIAFSTVLAPIPVAVLGAVHRVPDDFATIQEAADAAAAGDTVLVAPGVYAEGALIERPLSIIGAGRDATFLSRSDGRYAFGALETDLYIFGFDITTNGFATASGVVAQTSRVTLESSRIHDSDGGVGGGGVAGSAGSELVCDDVEFVRNTGLSGAVSMRKSQKADFTRCSFRDNKSAAALLVAGALEVRDGDVRITDCEFVGNTSGGFVGGITYIAGPGDSFVMERTLLAHNVGSSYGALHAEFGTVDIRNCTVVANTGNQGAGITAPNAIVTIKNTIVANNGPGPGVSCAGSQSTTRCCNIWGNGNDAPCGTAIGTIFLDPLFCGSARWDLQAASPCAPANSGTCGLVGAYDVACMTPVERTSWGRLKALMLRR